MIHLAHTVGALMSDDPVTADPDDRLDTADAMFALAESRHLPVVRDGKLVGVLSMRDILRAPEVQRVEQVMQRHVITATPEEPVVVAVRSLLEANISCLPVVRRGELVGIVTTTDFVRLASDHLIAHAEELGEPLTASQLMSPHPTVIHEDDRLNLAELIMKFGHFHHLPVVAGGVLVGIVSDRDLLAVTQSPQRTRLHVGEVMTRHPDTIAPRTEAAAAAGMLVSRGYGALPVVDHDALVGILTERDYLRYLLDRLSSSATSAFSSTMSRT